ncbi:MAG: alpha/beta fold hydrolase [Solirubrobacterales bacterium]
MAERLIEANGLELCTEAFGDPGDPPILLIMGIGASMLWWEEEFCRMLADRGRFVIRYDHRDTGRSTAFPPGRPGYTGVELNTDALAVLDGYELPAAHLVGVSAGAGIAQELALEHPDRVLSLVLISSSPAVSVDRELPGPTAEFMRFVGSAEVDWSDRESIVDFTVSYQRLLNGGEREFDEPAFRDLVRRDVERARDPAAVQNHDLLGQEGGSDRPLSAIAAPTLVIHGSADPMFPPAHGEALAAEVPDARFILLDGAGHGVFRPDWDEIAAAVADHTAPSE